MAKVVKLVCQICTKQFPKPTTRGRPPTRCPKCRAKIAAKKQPPKPKPQPKPEPVTVKQWTINCRACRNDFTMPAKQGRKPVHCPACSAPGTTKSSVSNAGNAVVDRLEMMLRSRGTHISQNRGEYE